MKKKQIIDIKTVKIEHVLPYNLRMIIRDNTQYAENEVNIIEAVEAFYLSIRQPIETNKIES